MSAMSSRSGCLLRRSCSVWTPRPHADVVSYVRAPTCTTARRTAPTAAPDSAQPRAITLGD
jgi:hypothetical protein